ncbi:phage tail fiber domain-containing protein [Enterobacter kobei]
MSVPNQTPYIIYNANGLTTVFPFEFYIINAGDIQVTVNGTVVTSGYSVSGVGNVGGGDVVFVTPPANGAVVMLERVVPTYRLTDYQDNGDLLADTVNKDFDRLWMAIQRAFIYLGLALRRPLFGGPFNAEGYRIANLGDPVNAQDAATKNYVDNVSLVRTLRVPESSVSILPPVDQRANKLLAFNAAGQPIVVLPTSGSASDVMIELAKPDGEKYIGECPDIATLRTIEPSFDKQRITVREHTANTGYGGGQFRAVLAGSGYTDNNGTVIKTTSGAVWLRINADVVNPLMFGAIPRVDNSTPSAHSAINLAINAASKKVDLVGYTYNVGDETLITTSSPLEFEYGKVFLTSNVANVFRINNAAHRINKVDIEGNFQTNSLGFNVQSNASNAIVENCKINNTGRCAITTASKANIVRNNIIDNAGFAGAGNFRTSIWMNEGEHNVMEGNICTHCDWGILMRNEIGVTQGFYNTMRNNIVVCKSTTGGASVDSQGISASAQFHLTTTGNIVRNFVDNGIDHQNCFGLLITNNQIAGCKDAVFIGDRSCGKIVISHNNIDGCQQGVRYYNPSSNPFTGQMFSDVVISNNSILGSLNYGIWVAMAGTSNANYNTNIVNNIVDGNGSGGLGIVLDNVQQGTCSQNTVRRVNGHGISLTTCESIKIMGNTVSDAGFGTAGTYNGINISSSNRCQAIGNSVTGATMLYAIVLGAGSFNMAHMNEARSTTGASAVNISGGTGNVESLNIKS